MESMKETIGILMAAFIDKDIEAVLACFTDDAVLYDPHYPTPEMKGIAAIRQGFEWGLGNMEKPGFTLRKFWSDGDSGAVEVDTHHVFKRGMEIKFKQVFVFKTQAGKITNLRAYTPYGPPGIGGFITKITRLIWRLQGKVRS